MKALAQFRSSFGLSRWAVAVCMSILAGCGGGESDTGVAVTALRERAAAVAVGQLILNEVHAANWKGQADEDGDAEDWVEIYNPTNDPIDASGLGLSNKPNAPFLWTFPSGTWILPKTHMPVWLSKKDRRVPGYPLHTNFNLDNGGDSLYLNAVTGSGTIALDSASPPLVKADQSWCRIPSGAVSSPFMVCTNPTFNAPNAGPASPTILAKPTFSVTSGFYASSLTVTISGPSGAEIRYTSDGNEPTAASPVATGPITVSASTVLRSSAFAAGAESSAVETATYIIDSALATKYTSLKAMLVAMPPGDFARFQQDDQSLASRASFEMIAAARTSIFKQDAEGSVAGQFGSYGAPQRSMNVNAKDVFGPKSFDVPLWSEKPQIASTKKFRLRNGSNDWQRAHMRDQFSQRLGAIAGPNLYGAATTVAVFINGSYYGMMDLREREDETLAANNLGIDKDRVDDLFDPLLPQQEIKNGGEAALSGYKAFHAFVTGNDMALQSNYDQALQMFSADSLAWDWALHMFHGNNDWPGRNVHVWRSPERDGRWNWHAHDMDLSFGLSWSVASDMTASLSQTGSEVINALLLNASFRNLFVNTAADQMNAMASERANARLDVMQAEMRPYVADHFAKSGLGTEATWVGHVNELREYLNTRAGYHDMHLRNRFALKNRAAINIAVNDAAMGTVKVNAIDAGSQMSASMPSWTGRYYPGVPVTLEAKPKPGYSFVGWQGTQPSGDAKITHTIPTTQLVNADGFSARWTGQVSAPADGSYLLRTEADDGVRVWLDGVLIIDGWSQQGFKVTTSSAIALQAGKRYDVVVEYYDSTGAATVRLLWRGPDAATFSPIPANQLYPSKSASLAAGLTGSYFNNQTLSGPPATTSIEPVDFMWDSGAPMPYAGQFIAIFAPGGTPSAPVLQAIGSQNLYSGDLVAIQVQAATPGSPTLQYSASKLPKGLDIHPTTGMISGTATTPGTYSAVITVKNGSAVSTITVSWTVANRVVAGAGPAPVKCSVQGAVCQLPAGMYDVLFAGGGYSVLKNMRGSVPCTDAVFGQQPSGTDKSCYYVPTVGVPLVLATPGTTVAYTIGTPIALAVPPIAPGGGVIARVEFYDGSTLLRTANAAPYSWTWAVAFGAHGISARITDSLGNSTTTATTSVVGTVTGLVKCAEEYGACSIPAGATADVYFGADGKFAVKTSATGSVACSNVTFGDPVHGVVKSCYSANLTYSVVNSAPVVVMTAPANNASYPAGTALTLAADATASSGAVVKVEFFDGSSLLGTATVAPYTVSWTASIGSHVFTARATDQQGMQTTSDAVNVNVNSAPIPIFCANENDVCLLPAGVTADVYYGVTGKQVVKRNMTGPVQCNSGTFGSDPAYLTAKSCSYVIISQSANLMPVVSLTSPVEGAAYPAGSPLTIAANASDSDGTIAKVEFFDGAVSLGSTTSAPYSLSWTPTPGSHTITARATDNLGAQTVSTPASFTTSDGNLIYCAGEYETCNLPSGATADVYYGVVGKFAVKRSVTESLLCSNALFGDPAWGVAKACYYVVLTAGNEPPIVLLTAPSANTNYSAGAAVTLTASASDADGTIAKVEFFDGTTLLGASTAAPYSLNWTATTGSHTFTAKATDNRGVQTTSSAVIVSVNAGGTPQFCASEGAVCVLPAGMTADVYYGANGNFAVKRNMSARIDCNNATFGDPIFGVVKSCTYVGVSAGT